MFVKIATWNVNSIKVRLPQVLQWMESEQPDILGLQETKLTDENFPASDIEKAGYHVVFSGQKSSLRRLRQTILAVPDSNTERVLLATRAASLIGTRLEYAVVSELLATLPALAWCDYRPTSGAIMLATAVACLSMSS